MTPRTHLSLFRSSESVEPLDGGPAPLAPKPEPGSAAATAAAAAALLPSDGNDAVPTGLTTRVKLASTACNPCTPATVFVHGLDSSKDTWQPVIQDFVKAGYPCVALDQRGHGETPIGDVADFGPDALAADILHAAAEHGINQPFILVCHSMGGRIGMRCAAMDAQRVAKGLPPLLAALVIEDIDVLVRPNPDPPDSELTEQQSAELRRWESPEGRRFETLEACEQALLPWYGNDKKRVRQWSTPNASTKIRVCHDGSGYWSDFNPAAKRLAIKRVLNHMDGAEAWTTMAAQARCEHEAAVSAAGGDAAFRASQTAGDTWSQYHCPVFLWISSPKGTVCTWEGEGGLNDMIAQFEGHAPGALSTKVYPGKYRPTRAVPYCFALILDHRRVCG